MGQLQVIINCEEGSKKAISYAQLHIMRENIHMHEKIGSALLQQSIHNMCVNIQIAKKTYAPIAVATLETGCAKSIIRSTF